jgi:hypothetical protein
VALLLEKAQGDGAVHATGDENGDTHGASVAQGWRGRQWVQLRPNVPLRRGAPCIRPCGRGSAGGFALPGVRTRCLVMRGWGEASG